MCLFPLKVIILLAAESQKGINVVIIMFPWEPERRYRHNTLHRDNALLVLNGTVITPSCLSNEYA